MPASPPPRAVSEGLDDIEMRFVATILLMGVLVMALTLLGIVLWETRQHGARMILKYNTQVQLGLVLSAIGSFGLYLVHRN